MGKKRQTPPPRRKQTDEIPPPPPELKAVEGTYRCVHDRKFRQVWVEWDGAERKYLLYCQTHGATVTPASPNAGQKFETDPAYVQRLIKLNYWKRYVFKFSPATGNHHDAPRTPRHPVRPE